MNPSDSSPVREVHSAARYLAAIPDLAELCRVHDIGMELIERCDDLDQLLDRVLGEYEARLGDLSRDALDSRRDPQFDRVDSGKLRALVMFASKAAALKNRAEATERLLERSEVLEQVHAQLASMLGALGAGILMVGPDGRVGRCNRAAATLLDVPEGDLVGRPAPSFLVEAPAGGDAEVRRDWHGRVQVLLVARRALEGAQGEVILVSDVTARVLEAEERHRLERLDEVMRALGVLSHKINNPLTALLGRAQMLQAKQGADPSVIKSAEVIQESARRIAELIRELGRVVKDGQADALEKVLDLQGTRGPEPGLR